MASEHSHKETFRTMEDNDAGTTQSAGSARRILIADDDPAILRLVATILEKEDFNVVTARDGREAYKILQADADFTAAILDVMMPHISGTELVRQMKTDTRLMNIPVMMMTAEQDPKLSKDSFAAGAVVFLPKPYRLPSTFSSLLTWSALSTFYILKME